METTPKFWWKKNGVAVLSRKPAISLKGDMIGPRLLFIYLFYFIMKSYARYNMKQTNRKTKPLNY